MKELHEKYSELHFEPSAKLNEDSLNRCRVFSNIFSGISAGTFGFGAGYGLLWWLVMNAVVAALLFIRINILGNDNKGQNMYF